MIHWKCARSLFALAAAVMLGGCVGLVDRQPALSGGILTGELALAWDNGLQFVAYPVEGNELAYALPKGHRLAAILGKIKPELMYTDGGSIPRAFWSFDGLSPWEYGPAFIIHDWMFNQHYCKKDAYPVTLAEANDILLDAMILLDAQVTARHRKPAHNTAEVRQLIDGAVTNFSAAAWNNGKCPARPKGILKVVFVEERRTEFRLLSNGRSAPVVRTNRIRKIVPRYTELFRLPTD
jgi:Protein of unknown function (DUF1353)